MVIHDDTHSRVIAHKKPVGKLGIIRVIAIIRFSISTPDLLEIPPTTIIIDVGESARFVTIVQNIARVVAFDNQAQPHKREVVIAGSFALAGHLHLGNEAVKGI